MNFRCSVCDAHTSGPRANTEKSFSIGKAAHIKAAAPGGPRYDPSQTPEERRSFENGIWCCANCADRVDRDAGRYSVDQLKQLKANAEQLATERIGRTTVELRTPVAVRRAVEEFCRTEEVRWEQQDPRFNVSVNWENGHPVYRLRAREPVSGQLVIGVKKKKEYIEGLRDVLDYGGTHTFQKIDVRMEGSPLFAPNAGTYDHFQISTQARSASITAIFGGGTDSALYLDFAGQATYGFKGFRFTGSVFSELLVITLSADHNGGDTRVGLTFNLQKWEHKPLLHLPYFERLKQVLSSLSNGTRVQLSVDVNGAEVGIGSATLDSSTAFGALRAFVHEVEVLRKLDVFFGLDLTMPGDLDEILRDQGDVGELLSMIEISNAEKQEIAVCIIPAAPVSDLVTRIERQHSGTIALRQEMRLRIMGQSYGPFWIELSCPQAIMVAVGPSKIVEGREVRLLLRATEGHHWSSRCLDAKDAHA